MAFNLIYWVPLCGKYFFLLVFPLGKMWKNTEKRPFFRVAMAALESSIGLRYHNVAWNVFLPLCLSIHNC